MTGAPQGMQRFAERFVDVVPHVKALGLKFHSMGENWAILELPYGAHLIGFPDTGIISGGAIFSLMDSVAGLSVFAALRSLNPTATLDLRLDYLKPASPGRAVFGRADCYKITRRVAFIRGVAYHDDEDRPIANVTGSFMLAEV